LHHDEIESGWYNPDNIIVGVTKMAEQQTSRAKAQAEVYRIMSEAVNPGTRIAALRAYWQQAGESEGIIATLLQMLREGENGFLRGKAAQALFELNPSAEVITALRERLHAESDEDVHLTLAPVLARAGFLDEVIDELVSRIRREDFSHKCAVYALDNALRASGVKRPELADMLLELLKNHEDGGVRFAAATALAEVGDSSERVIDGLFYTLEHDNNDVVHSAALDTLNALRPEDHAIVERLIDLLLSSEYYRGWPLTERLARMNVTEADIARLLYALENAEGGVKDNAVGALKELAAKLTTADLERLIAALNGEDWEKINAAGHLLQDLAKDGSKWRKMLNETALSNRELQTWLTKAKRPPKMSG
jgi:hypothetical protein